MENISKAMRFSGTPLVCFLPGHETDYRGWPRKAANLPILGGEDVVRLGHLPYDEIVASRQLASSPSNAISDAADEPSMQVVDAHGITFILLISHQRV